MYHKLWIGYHVAMKESIVLDICGAKKVYDHHTDKIIYHLERLAL